MGELSLGVSVIVDVDVPGDPAPQGSKRLLRNQHTGRLHSQESSKRVAPWRADVRDTILRTLGPDPGHAHTGPVMVDLTFRLARPASHYGSGANTGRVRSSAPNAPIRKPDLDKLTRAVLDAIQSTGMVYVDDAQVVVLVARKVYTGPYERQPGVHIRVRRAE